MTDSRPQASLALLAFVLGAVSLAYATGAFVMGLALHAPDQRGWSLAEMIAVSLYPFVWIAAGWGVVAFWNRPRKRTRPHDA